MCFNNSRTLLRVFLFLVVFTSFAYSQEDFNSPTLRVPEQADPPRPWAEAAQQNLPPGEAGRDYTPAVVPNGKRAEYKVVDGVKVFHLVAEPIEWQVAEGLQIKTWGYNGSVPGPMI